MASGRVAAESSDVNYDDEELLDNGEEPIIEEPQDPEVRRDIRSKYRSLLNDVSTIRSEILAGDTMVLKEKIDTTNAIFENVKHPREAALDAQCCSSIAALGKQKVQALSTGFSNFSTIEFCEKLITRLGRTLPTTTGETTPAPAMDRNSWVRLGTASQTFFRRSPALHFMFGLLNRERKLAKPRAVKDTEQEKIDKQATASKPKQSSDFGKSTGESTTVEVENILKILRMAYRRNDRSPICYFEFVTNPDSFSQTIENVFYTSFLVRDGYARMFLDDDELPVIEPVEGATGIDMNGSAVETGESHQMIMSWTMNDWKEIVDSFEITQPLIPTRRRQHGPVTAANPSGELATSTLATASTSATAARTANGSSSPRSKKFALEVPSTSQNGHQSSAGKQAQAVPSKSSSHHKNQVSSDSDDSDDE